MEALRVKREIKVGQRVVNGEGSWDPANAWDKGHFNPWVSQIESVRIVAVPQE